MAMRLYNDADISDIAAAIREKNGTQTQYKVGEMGDAVRAIPSGSTLKEMTLSIVNNTSDDVRVNYVTTDSDGGVFNTSANVTANSTTPIDVVYDTFLDIRFSAPSVRKSYYPTLFDSFDKLSFTPYLSRGGAYLQQCVFLDYAATDSITVSGRTTPEF